MKPILLLSLLVILAACNVNKDVYKSSDFEQKAYRHKTVAILPLKITQTGYRQKNESDESIKASNEKWGYTFQESLLTYALKHTVKKKKSPEITFQSIQKTNALLKEAGWKIEDIYDKQPEEIAKLLGVDAVLLTTLEREKNMSDNLAYGVAGARAVLGVIKPGTITGPYINASDLNMNSYIYNGTDSKLLWKTFRKGGTDLPSDVNGVVEYYSNWIAKKIPYKSS